MNTTKYKNNIVIYCNTNNKSQEKYLKPLMKFILSKSDLLKKNNNVNLKIKNSQHYNNNDIICEYNNKILRNVNDIFKLIDELTTINNKPIDDVLSDCVKSLNSNKGDLFLDTDSESNDRIDTSKIKIDDEIKMLWTKFEQKEKSNPNYNRNNKDQDEYVVAENVMNKNLLNTVKNKKENDRETIERMSLNLCKTPGE